MRKPDSPLNTQIPRGSWREGRSAPSRRPGQPVWEQPEGRRPGPRRYLEPGTQERHRSQAAEGELGRVEDPELEGSQLAELSQGMGWEKVFHPGPVAPLGLRKTGVWKGRGLDYRMTKGWRPGRRKGCYLQIPICMVD